MIIRSKAPLRLGLAGGGTDVSPFSELYGGKILNASINLYAYCTLIPTNNGKIEFINYNNNSSVIYESTRELEINLDFQLAIGVYNRIVRDFVKEPLSFKLSSFVEAPPGSGLGSSSTLVVAILGAFAEWQGLALGEYEIAHLAYEIERQDLNMSGGKQDQYAATFGGFNFMEFYDGDKVIVNPLRINRETLNELSNNIVIFFTGRSRLSSSIIDEQKKNVDNKNNTSIEAMQKLKEQAKMMKEALLKKEFYRIGEILNYGWLHKKAMAEGISNAEIDQFYKTALQAGAIGGKISGAGGGGFMMFYCPEDSRYSVIQALEKSGAQYQKYEFTEQGLLTWKYEG